MRTCVNFDVFHKNCIWLWAKSNIQGWSKLTSDSDLWRQNQKINNLPSDWWICMIIGGNVLKRLFRREVIKFFVFEVTNPNRKLILAHLAFTWKMQFILYSSQGALTKNFLSKTAVTVRFASEIIPTPNSISLWTGVLFDDDPTESELTSGSEVSMPWLPGDNGDSRYGVKGYT